MTLKSTIEGAFMPLFIGAGNSARLKTGVSGIQQSDSTTFFANYYTSQPLRGTVGNNLAHGSIPVNSRVTLFSDTGGGVLTSLVMPTTTAGGVSNEIWITVDGEERYFNFPNRDANTRMYLAAFLGYQPSTVQTISTGYGSYQDFGYDNSPQILNLSPAQAVEQGFGIPYSDSIVVEIRVSNRSTTAGQGYAGAVGMNFSRFGLKERG